MKMRNRVFGILALIGAPGYAETHRTDEARERLETIDPVVVTATRTERLLGDAVVRTDVLDRSLMEQTASRNLADALEWVPGLRVENNCQNCNFNQIRLLGLQGNFTQVLNNGRPALSSLAAVYGVEQIPAAMIDRIEVVKGGGSALYGPGAVAGVVNIIPRTPVVSGGRTNYEWSTYGGGPNHKVDAGLDWVSTDGTASLTVFASRHVVAPWDANSDGFTEIGEREFTATGMRLILRPTDTGQLALDYTWIDEFRRGGDRLNEPVTSAMVAEQADSRIHLGGIAWSDEPTDHLRYELNASGTRTKRDTYYGADQDPNAFGNSSSPTYLLDGLVTYQPTDALAVSAGLQYQEEKLEDEQPAYDRFTQQAIRNTGILAQAEWFGIAGWDAVTGGRLDFNSSLDDPVFSPRFSLKRTLGEEWTLRASYASGFQAPRVFDEDLHITQVGGAGQVLRNSPDLQEESARTYMLGIEWVPEDSILTRWNESARRPLVIESNLFLTRLNNPFEIIETNNPATRETEFTRINAEGARVYGIEMNIGWQFANNWRLDLGYVEQRARFDEPAGDFGRRSFERTPERYGIGTVMWDAPWCEVFVGAKYTGRMDVPHYAGFISEDRLARSPSFLTLDIGLRKRFMLQSGIEATLQAGVQNVFDSYQRDLDRGPERDAGYVYGPRAPRTVHLGCGISF